MPLEPWVMRTGTSFRSRLRYPLAASVFFLLVVLVLLYANGRAPSAALRIAVQVITLLFLASCAVTAATALSAAWRERADLRFAMVFILLLIGALLVLHFYTIGVPTGQDCYNSEKGVYGCIMDEVYYVPASQNILSGTQCAPYSDNCNLEHPFLGKAFIAAGIAVFGLNSFGWRFSQVIVGTACIPLLFALVLRLSGDRRMAYFSALFLSADTMFFVHSGAALIDVQPVFFALAGFLLYFMNLRWWKFDSFILAGVFLGLAGLSKETAVFLLGALLTYHTLFSPGTFRQWVVSTAEIVGAAAVVFLAGLQLYASLYASSAFPTFVQDLSFVIGYGSGLRGVGWTDTAFGTVISPINWLTFYSPVGYLITHITETVTQANGTVQSVYTGIGYYGVTNMLVLWMVFAWVPYLGLEIYRRRRDGNAIFPPSKAHQTAVFGLIWLAWGYLPYVGLWLYGRVTYPFYIVPAVPALATGTAYFVSRDWFSPKIAYVFLAAVLGWFFLFYPDKAFLPVWLRVLLGK